MATLTSAPVDHELLAGLRAGDEHALERLLRLRHAELHDTARRELGPDAARAPRAVEYAVLRVWGERDRIVSPGGLDLALNDALQHGIVRERGRAAAVHRLEARHGTHHPHHDVPEPNADAAWAHVAAVLHHAPESPAEHAERVRHGTAQHIAQATSRPKLGLTAVIAAVIAVLAIVAYYSVDRTSDEIRATRGLTAPDARLVSTRSAQQANLALGAGTQAALQPDSRLTTPADFGPRLRVAGLDGAAMFTVAAGGERAFEVRTPRATVTSDDGEIAVRAYPDEATTAVLARRGRATVRTQSGNETLDAGQAVQVAADGRIAPLAGTARDAALSWVEGRFAVTDRPVREVLPALRGGTTWRSNPPRRPSSTAA
jgi:ferric-dicitrate binding protein FerR (iron transport regulator)